METPLKTLLSFLLLLGIASAEPPVIDDTAITDAFQEGVGAFADSGEHLKAEDLIKALKNCPKHHGAPPAVSAAPEDASDSVFLIGTVYKCDQCDQWHPGGVATAWCLSADGLMVTNHHVFAHAQGAAMGICDRHGNTWPVTEILAANEADDLAIFRVKGSGFKPLPIGKPARIGDEIRVISHPDHRYYMQTFGRVSRYHRHSRKKSTWMSITADYAKGSSGAPVFNRQGEVVGMVSSTQSIYYELDKGKPKQRLQMVIKNCVPIAALSKMLKAES